MNELISVIIPVYKVEKWLNRCVDSVINQTYKNLDIILIDDGSPDRCGEMCEEYCKKDDRVRVFHQSNAGPSAARNKGLHEAKGEYIGFVDADDYIDNNMYQNMQIVAEKNHADILICGCYEVLSNDTNTVNHGYGSRIIEGNSIISEVIYNHYMGKGRLFSAVWNKLYRHHILKNNNVIFDESLNWSEDNFFNLDVFYYAQKVAFLDSPLYYYVKQNESLTQSFRRTQLEDWRKYVERSLSLNDECFRLKFEISRYYCRFIRKSVDYLARAFSTKRDDRLEIFAEFYYSEFYRKLIVYDKYAPLYVRSFCWLVRKKQFILAKLTIKLYALLKGMKHA